MQPLFAPGVLFNTIKSGVACDYWSLMDHVDLASNYRSITAQANLGSADSNIPVLSPTNSSIDSHIRIPFEALVEPEKHLSNRDIYLSLIFLTLTQLHLNFHSILKIYMYLVYLVLARVLGICILLRGHAVRESRVRIMLVM